HTLLVPVALALGLQTVGEAMADADVARFLSDALEEEVIPALPLPAAELLPFAASVQRRFRNPYVQHRLSSIALNSWSKFASRLMPQLLRFQALHGRWLPRLVLALAATLRLYRDPPFALSDTPEYLDWFARSRGEAELVQGWLANAALWGTDLNQKTGLGPALQQALAAIDRQGMRAAVRELAA
ncbi:MAG TPA: hypothetical protein VGE47_15890, partial [Burkholderiaceae bacterium]